MLDTDGKVIHPASGTPQGGSFHLVCAFEYQEDAKALFKALEFRLEKFGLQLAADKSRAIHFSRCITLGSSRFDFLGYEFRWDKDRAGKPQVVLRTSRKKLRNSIAIFTQWCKQNRNVRLNVLFPQLNRKLRGYYNYYGVKGNAVGIQEFYCLPQDLETALTTPGGRAFLHKPNVDEDQGAAGLKDR